MGDATNAALAEAGARFRKIITGQMERFGYRRIIAPQGWDKATTSLAFQAVMLAAPGALPEDAAATAVALAHAVATFSSAQPNPDAAAKIVIARVAEFMSEIEADRARLPK